MFCRDLDVEPENIALLVLSWKMGAKQMGYFTLQEWLLGLTDLQLVHQQANNTIKDLMSFLHRCDSLTKLQGRITHLHSLLNDSTHFKSIYRYAFDFSRVGFVFIKPPLFIFCLIMTTKFIIGQGSKELRHWNCQSNVRFIAWKAVVTSKFLFPILGSIAVPRSK